MDCETALNQLELLPPDPEAALDPALDPERIAEAMSHVAECSQEVCGQAFAMHQQWNKAITEAFNRVAVPVGLKERIQQSLLAVSEPADQAVISAEAVSDVKSATEQSKPVQPVSRRAPLVVGGAIAACFLLGLGWWALPQLFPQATITLSDLQLQTSEQLKDFAELQDFPGDIETQMPESWQSRRDIIAYGDSGKLLSLKSTTGKTPITASLISFRVSARPRAIPGVLAMLPVRFVESPPKANSPQNAKVIYQRDYLAVSWTEDDYVYICYLNRQRNTMQQLLDALELPPA